MTRTEIIREEVMESLKTHIGKRVTIEHVWYGTLHKEKSRLRGLENFVNVETENSGIPFVGYGSAIRRITAENGKVLYKNPRIPKDYDLRANVDVDRAVRLSFGDEIANKRIKVREESERDWEERKAAWDSQAKAKSASLIEEGKIFVKPELEGEWQEYARNNTQDGYSAAVVDVSNKVAKALSEGKSPKEAAKTMYDTGITGFQAGCVAQAISHFHPRGDEFRKYWNKQYLSNEQAKTASGVVNPAIWTLRR